MMSDSGEQRAPIAVTTALSASLSLDDVRANIHVSSHAMLL